MNVIRTLFAALASGMLAMLARSTVLDTAQSACFAAGLMLALLTLSVRED